MKKRTYFKPKKKYRVKKFPLLLVFILGIYLTYQYLDNNIKKIDQKELVEILLSNKKETNIVKSITSTFLPNKKNMLEKIMNKSYQNKIIKEEKQKQVIKEVSENPIIYIYNSHQTEEYTPSTFVEYSINPTVQMNNYVLEEVFEKNNYKTITEERNIKQVLNEHNWNYAYSYDASRVFLEDVKNKYPSLKYFIDVHRDSLKKEKTTVTINDKNYAKILFLIGLENPNYQKNQAFTERINQKLNEKYPNLSKGILQKQGEGVNGVYYQGFFSYTSLVAIGGPENTIDEVLNTSLAFSECFLEVIREDEL